MFGSFLFENVFYTIIPNFIMTVFAKMFIDLVKARVSH